MALLILVPKENLVSLEKALNTFVPYDWREGGSIRLRPVDPSAPEETASLCEYCQSNGIDEILVPKRLHCDETELREAGYRVTVGSAISELVRGRGLQKELQRLRLEWRSEVLARLENFGLHEIREREMDHWLEQFESLGNHRAVGEHLLQLLEVMSLSDLGESLSAGSGFYGEALVVGFNNDKWGKSWATVSNVIRKRCAAAELLPIADAVQAGKHPKVLRLVEDGLFSGTEMQAIFESLRGTRPPDRVQKVPKLPDPGLLSTVPIRLHFSVVCDFGEAVLRQYTAAHSLPNVQVVVVGAAKTYRVLRAPGAPEPGDKVTGGEDLGDHAALERLRSRVVPFAFQDDRRWPSPDAQRRARQFCETIGEQLWTNYTRKKKFDHAAWPPDRIRRCSLGMESLGLAFAFPHSVPKATLPVFWATGNVTFGGRSFEWQPLFPNADT